MESLTYEVTTRKPVNGLMRHEFETFALADTFAYEINGSDEFVPLNDLTLNYAIRVGFGPQGRTKK